MAQASAKDVRDILNIPAPSQSQQAEASTSTLPASRPPPGPPVHSSKSRSKPKIDGITRELHALLGDNAPSLAVAHKEARALMSEAGQGAGRGFMPKFKKKDRKARHWERQAFKNPARTDGLILNHWAPAKDQKKASGEENVENEYAFAVFSANSGVYKYSGDEYFQHLRDEDWTKEETDYLMDLCSMYDLRFVIIADRWDWPASSHKSRTMEDLKARYYAICRRLIRSRISVEDMESRQQLLQTYAFDKSREHERKAMLARLFTRTPAELAEEEALYVEARRLEQQEAKFAADREDLLKLLGGWERVPNVSTALIAEAGAGVGAQVGAIPGTPGGAVEEAAALGEARRKKRKGLDGTQEDDAGSTAPSSSKAPPVLTARQKAELKQAQFDETHCITRFDPDSAPMGRPPYPFLVGTPSTAPPLAPSPANPTSSHGAYFRSVRLLAPRQPQLNRTMQTLAESNPPIGPRLVFPTRQNCEKWEGLLGAVTSSLEMKKQTDRIESELRIAKSRVQALLGADKDRDGGQSATPTTTIPPAKTTGRSATPRDSTPRSATPRTILGGESRGRGSRSATPASGPVRRGHSIMSRDDLEDEESRVEEDGEDEGDETRTSMDVD